MSNNTRIVTTNVTCETAFDLNVCQDFANVTEIIADKNEEIEEMKIEVSERELEIDNKDGVIDSFTMNVSMSSKYRRVSDADQRLFSDVSMCNIVVCEMREACGSSINVDSYGHRQRSHGYYYRVRV
jgi:hypothetical protein